MQTAINATGDMPIRKSPYSQKADTPATPTKAFNRTVGLACEQIKPEAESLVYQLFNSQLPATKVPFCQARALRDYVIMQLNNYLTTNLLQPDIAITEHTDSASDISDRDSSSSSPSAETGNISGSPQSAELACERDRQQALCRQLVNLKATVTSRNLGLDNDKIRKHLKQQLRKNIYKNFKHILREQPRTEKAYGGNVDMTNRMINTIFIMGQATYQPFFNALSRCGYHGLFQPDIYPGQNLDPFLNRTNSLPDRFHRHRSQQVSQISSSQGLSDYPEYHQGVQPAHRQPAVLGPKVIRLSNDSPVAPDDSPVVPIRISKKALPRESRPPAMPSFKPPATPPRKASDAKQQTANLMAAEVHHRDFLLSKTAALRDSGSYPPPPPPLYVCIEEEQDNG